MMMITWKEYARERDGLDGFYTPKPITFSTPRSPSPTAQSQCLKLRAEQRIEEVFVDGSAQISSSPSKSGYHMPVGG